MLFVPQNDLWAERGEPRVERGGKTTRKRKKGEVGGTSARRCVCSGNEYVSLSTADLSTNHRSWWQKKKKEGFYRRKKRGGEKASLAFTRAGKVFGWLAAIVGVPAAPQEESIEGREKRGGTSRDCLRVSPSS